MYSGLHMIGWLLIREPPMILNDNSSSDTVCTEPGVEKQENTSYGSCATNLNMDTEQIKNIVPMDALRTKEFYLVYFCRFLITPITQVKDPNLQNPNNFCSFTFRMYCYTSPFINLSPTWFR